MASDQDRLSFLPNSLLLHILSSTESYRTAVICSVLSKRWVSLYNELPRLYLQYNHIIPCDFEHRTSLDNIVFMTAVTSALSRHRVDFQWLSLEAISADADSREALNLWLECAADRRVLHLSISNPSCYGSDRPQDVPQDLFSYKYLVFLSISGFTINKCPGFGSFSGFQCLKNCYLRKVFISQLDWFVDSCPRLQLLDLSDSSVKDRLSVSSESLEILRIDNVWEYKSRVLEIAGECPKLREITAKRSSRGHYLQLQCEKFKFLGKLLLCLEYGRVNQDGQIVELCLSPQFEGCILGDKKLEQLMGSVGVLSNLKILRFYGLEACPTMICRAAATFQLLSSLTLTHCKFREEREGTYKTQIPSPASKFSLKAVHVTLKTPTPGETLILEMLSNKCQKLRTMVVTFENSWIKGNEKRFLELRRQIEIVASSRWDLDINIEVQRNCPKSSSFRIKKCFPRSRSTRELWLKLGLVLGYTMIWALSF